MSDATESGYGYGTLIIVTVIIILLDQITKTLITGLLSLHQSVEVIGGLFNIIYIRNPGAAFGILGDWGTMRTLLLIVVSIAALVVIVYLYSKSEDRFSAIALSLVAGGAAGNLIDRVRFGEVIDFLDFSLAGYHWPAFNVADSAITVGVVVMIAHAVLKREGSNP
ncbi:MAG: signal peptidase II [Thermodesulfobacteriota bacterium]